MLTHVHLQNGADLVAQGEPTQYQAGGFTSMADQCIYQLKRESLERLYLEIECVFFRHSIE